MRHCLILTAALALAACDADPAAHDRARAAEEFQAAFIHLERAKAGYIAEREAADFDGTLEEYRQGQLREAAVKLDSASRAAGRGQELAARRALSEVHASLGRYHMNTAARLRSGQSPEAAELLATLSAARDSLTLADAYADARDEDELANINRMTREIEAEIERVSERADEMGREIDQLRSDQARHNDGRDAAMREADRLARQAFEASGQLEYDLYVQSAQKTREADELAARIDTIDAQLDVLEAERQVQLARVDDARNRLTALTEARDDLTTRSSEASELAAEFREGFNRLADKFEDDFRSFAARREESVEPELNQAIEQMRQAVAALDDAERLAASDDVVYVQLERAARQAELGQAILQQALLTQPYHNLLEALAPHAREVKPNLASAIDEALAQTAERIASYEEQAQAHLNEASTTLADAAERARDRDIQVAAYGQLVSAHRALGQVTGDAAHQRQADSYRERILEIQR